MLPRQENLSAARQIAVEALRKANLEERAARSGARFEPTSGKVGLRYLGRNLWITFPEATICDRDRLEPLSPREEILILHYLERASGIPLTEKWVSFSEIPGGTFYHPVFLQRCKAPLVKFFGDAPENLLSVAAEKVGAEPWSMGDGGAKIQAFPSVRLGLVLWKGDEEFPPEGNVLFDSSITGYLSVEDIVILAETVVWKLIKAGHR